MGFVTLAGLEHWVGRDWLFLSLFWGIIAVCVTSKNIYIYVGFKILFENTNLKKNTAASMKPSMIPNPHQGSVLAIA